MFDYSDCKCVFLSRDKIWEKADSFRKRYWPNGILPIDMEHIIEKGLCLNIIPEHDIKRLLKIDAYLLSDLKGIVVDISQYMDDLNRYEKRLRFTFAHEVGHLVLHKYIFKKFDFISPKEYLIFMDNFPEDQYSNFEYQANEFGGRLLVPRENLVIELNHSYEIIKCISHELC